MAASVLRLLPLRILPVRVAGATSRAENHVPVRLPADDKPSAAKHRHVRFQGFRNQHLQRQHHRAQNALREHADDCRAFRLIMEPVKLANPENAFM